MKKLIVLATLAALPAVAVADVAITGNIGVALSNVKVGDAGSTNNMSRHAGQIVFSGNEDLGNGIKAVWQVANRIDPAGDETGASTQWANRDTFIGVSGDFGRVRFGNVSSPTNSGYGSQVDQTYQLAGSGISMSSGAARHKHSVRFDSANYGGFEFAVSHQIKEATAAVASPAADRESRPAYANDFGVKYKSSLFSVQATVENRVNATVKGKTDRHTQLSGGTSFGDLGLYAGYAEKRVATATSHKKNSGFGIAANYKLDKLTFTGSLWNERDSVTDGVKADDDFRALTLGVNYDISKRTYAGFELSTQNESLSGKKDDRRATAVYLFHKF